MTHALGLTTDLAILRFGGSSVERHGALTLVRSPQEPQYYWGNFVLAPEIDDLDDALALFTRELPAAEHVAIAIEGAPPDELDARAAERALAVELTVVLTTTAPQPPRHPNADAELRTLSGDEDFAQARAVHQSTSRASEQDFVARRMRTWRAMTEAGHGRWYGAFVDGVMRAGLGVFDVGDGVARYQAVDTHPDFQRRGLAGTLVHHAGHDALTWPGIERLVIVADPHHHAIDIYRSLGFAPLETQTQLLRPPPESC